MEHPSTSWAETTHNSLSTNSSNLRPRIATWRCSFSVVDRRGQTSNILQMCRCFKHQDDRHPLLHRHYLILDSHPTPVLSSPHLPSLLLQVMSLSSPTNMPPTSLLPYREPQKKALMIGMRYKRRRLHSWKALKTTHEDLGIFKKLLVGKLPVTSHIMNIVKRYPP